MKFWRSRRKSVVAALLLFLALFGIRPGANRLRARIVNSIGQALGRRVDVGSVNLRLLPRPGFDLENFVVHDPPGFSAEPMLRAGEVTASLRLTSLVRGHLEIARLSLSQPSLNLVRDSEGRWNLEDLLTRAAQVEVAPTNKGKTERRPGFPYIEADQGRINLKMGAEKKPYALTDADFALWQESEDAWGIRLKGRPIRSDFNLTDTGRMLMAGFWRRAVNLHDTPLQFSLRWDDAQLGQLTKLMYGDDKGWRGAAKVNVALTGTPANLRVEARASVDDFRRYDNLASGAMRLAAQCTGRYELAGHAFSDIACRAPVGEGSITLAGNLGSVGGWRSYDLSVTADEVPIRSLLELARHAKQGVPDDLTAAGGVDAKIRIRKTAGEGLPTIWEGGGETSGFRLSSGSTNAELSFGTVPFVFASPRAKLRAATRQRTDSVETQMELGPTSVALGKSTPLALRGSVSRTGYNVAAQGDASLQRLLRAARTVGIPSPQPSADGTAKIDLQVTGQWSGSSLPVTTGKAQLHSVRAEVRGLNGPVEINSASLVFVPDRIQVQNILASAAGSTWRGSLTLPRPCAQAATCSVSFDLRADEISIERLNQFVNPHVRKQPWYGFLYSSASGAPYLLTLNARGRLMAGRLLIHQLSATQVSTGVDLREGKLRLSDLRADFLGGKNTGEWTADFTAKPPIYSGSGALARISLSQLAGAMHDGWITGSADAAYKVTASGLDASELLASASSILQVDVRDGSLPHVALEESASPLQIRRMRARLVLNDGQFTLEEGKLESPSGAYDVSGTASLQRILDLKLMRDGALAFNITGSLDNPQISAVTTAETRAELKPQ